MSEPRSTAAYRLEVLDRGVRLLTAPMPDRPSASIALMFRVGSRYEAPGVAGVSHFLEHMLFKGSSKYPSARAVAEAIEGLGGVMNAGTEHEVTVYWAKVASEHLPIALDVLCDIAQHPLLDPSEADKEREVIVEELRMYKDNPADHVWSVLEQMLWPGHPLGVDVAGTEESVRGIGTAELEGHMRRHYRGGGLVVAVGGNVRHEEVASLLGERLQGWEAGLGDAFAPALPGPTSPEVRIAGKDTEQVNILLATRALSYMDPERHALDLLNTILGEGMSSRLFLEVRERRGLCYDVHSWTEKLADTGAAGVYIGTDPSRAGDAVAAVLEELRRLSVEPVAAAELTKAREYLKGRFLLSLERTESLPSFLGSQELTTNEMMEVDEVIAAVDAVTAEDLMRVAQATFDAQPLQLAVVGPLESEQPLLEMLQATRAAA